MRKIPSIALYVFAFFALCLMLHSCEILKTQKSVDQESSALSKKNSGLIDTSSAGAVKKNETNSKENYDWFRMIQQFPQQKGDSSVTNVYNYPQPATVIYEGGTGTREQTSTTIDSTWFKNAITSFSSTIDSLTNKIAVMESSKQSETKGIGISMVIIIVICGFIAYFLIKWGLKRFKIVKK
jgi:hypothetical protein